MDFRLLYRSSEAILPLNDFPLDGLMPDSYRNHGPLGSLPSESPAQQRSPVHRWKGKRAEDSQRNGFRCARNCSRGGGSVSFTNVNSQPSARGIETVHKRA